METLFKNQLKIVFGITLALIMGGFTLILYDLHTLRFAWAKGFLLALAVAGIWGYLYARRMQQGKGLSYFKAYKNAVIMASIAFACYSAFIFLFSEWVLPATVFHHITPFELSVLVLLGGVFLSAILVFMLLPIFKRRNPEVDQQALIERK